MTVEEGALRETIWLEVSRVLNEGEFDAERLRRVEAMARGGAEFLAAAYLQSEGRSSGSGLLLEEQAAKIQAARLEKLGFTPERIARRDVWTERRNQQSTEGLIRAAQVFGVGDDDDEEEEVEEVAVRVQAPYPRGSAYPEGVSPGTKVILPLKMVQRLIDMLMGSDGDVADQLIDLLNACNIPPDVSPDAGVPVDFGLVYMGGVIGLADPAVVAEHPDAPKLSEEIRARMVMTRPTEEELSNAEAVAIAAAQAINAAGGLAT
jgi:hypothetical protein